MPSMPRKVDANALRVAIVGGSMGGLTTALLLRTLGHDVDVFERATGELTGFGAGIVAHEVTFDTSWTNDDFARQHDRPGPYLPASQRGRFTALGRTRRVPFRLVGQPVPGPS